MAGPTDTIQSDAPDPQPTEPDHEKRSLDTSSQSDKTTDETHPPLPNGTGEPPSETPQSSPDQPDNPPPYSIYTLWEKRLIVLAASLSAFFSPLTAQIYLPALPALSRDLGVTAAQINLTVTTYLIFQGVTPMFIGGFADTAGRRPAYLICFVVYIAANVGLALSKDYASVLVVRALQSAGSSTTVALNQAVVADIITSAERGQYIGITVIPVVLAPSLGPVIGGLLSQYLGWQSIFWFLAIAAVVTMIPMLFFFPETCRKIVGDGSVRPPLVYRTFWQMIKDWRRKRRAARKDPDNAALQRTPSTASTPPKFKFQTPNVLGSIIILFEPEVGCLLFYSGLVMGGFYAIGTALPGQLQSHYGYNDVQIGLCYLPLAGGSILTAFLVGPLINRNYRRHAARLGLAIDKTRQTDLTRFPIEKARLDVGIPLLVLNTAVMLVWGWVMQERVHVAVPLVLLFVMGIGIIGFVNTVNALLIDIYPQKAGAAVAANNLTRCLLGALFSAVIEPMINTLGSGWAFFLMGGLFIVFFPLLWLVRIRGPKWRAAQKARDKRRREKKDARRREKGTAEGGESAEEQDHGAGGVVGGSRVEGIEKEKP